jgi:MFS family permease
MSFIGLNWYVYQISGSSIAVATLMVINLISALLAAPVAGGMCDRYNRRSVMFASNLVRGIAIFGILLGTTATTFPLWSAYIIAFVNGVGNAFYLPASRAFVQEILQPKEFEAGNSLLEMSLQVGMLFSAGLAGLIFNLIGLNGVLAIDSSTFLLSLLFLRRIRYVGVEVNTSDEGFMSQLKGGMQYLARVRNIMLLGILGFVPYVVTISSNVVLPGYIYNILNADAVAFGISDMCYGVGAFCSVAFVAAFVPRGKRIERLLLLFLISAISLGVLFANTSLAILYVCFIGFGVANSSIKIVMNTILMERVPKSTFGRAMAFWMFIATLFQIWLSLVLGVIIDILPENYGYAILAMVMVCTPIVLVRYLRGTSHAFVEQGHPSESG